MANGQSHRNGAGFYEIPGHEGTLLPSVTTILGAVGKPALIQWSAKVERELVIGCAADLYETSKATPPMARMAYIDTLTRFVGKEKAGERLKAKAGDIGKRLHALVEYQMLKELGKAPPKAPKLDSDLAVPWSNWETFRQTHGLKPKLVEQMVYSLGFGYAGTLDLLGEFEGMPRVMDWKTGKDIYPESFLQASAYRMALIEMGHAGRDSGAAIVLLPKTEGDEFKVALLSPDECDKHFEVFLAVKELWAWQDGYEQKRKAAWEAGKKAPADVQGSPAPTVAEVVPALNEDEQAASDAAADDLRREPTSDSDEELFGK